MPNDKFTITPYGIYRLGRFVGGVCAAFGDLATTSCCLCLLAPFRVERIIRRDSLTALLALTKGQPVYDLKKLARGIYLNRSTIIDENGVFYARIVWAHEEIYVPPMRAIKSGETNVFPLRENASCKEISLEIRFAIS